MSSLIDYAAFFVYALTSIRASQSKPAHALVVLPPHVHLLETSLASREGYRHMPSNYAVAVTRGRQASTSHTVGLSAPAEKEN